jgi:holo-[acyl-carrier protein] synthase
MKTLIQQGGIGIDIIDVERFRKKIFKQNIKFYQRIFLESEIKYCLRFKSPYEHFAGKFALKESVIKSIHDKISFLDIKTSNSKYGPIVRLVGEKSKEYSFLCSISHEKKFAVAVVISSRPTKTKRIS